MSRTDRASNLLSFAPDWDQPTRYMERSRDWYLTLGYGNPYAWAHYREVPFQPPTRPLSEMKVTLITTAALHRPDKGDQGPGAPYNAAAKFYEVYTGSTQEAPDLRISHVGIDRTHTTATDSRTWFPLPALREQLEQGRIGSIAERFYGVPTNRSQRRTLEVDCPKVLSLCREDDVDAVVLVPNCPICHQTASLMARYLEANGIITVVMGAAKDVVESCGVPRFLFSDFPLGNSAGRPDDPESQRQTMELALRLLESAPGPRTTVQNSVRWDSSGEWHRDYLSIEGLSESDISRLRTENDQIKKTTQQVRDGFYTSS